MGKSSRPSPRALPAILNLGGAPMMMVYMAVCIITFFAGLIIEKLFPKNEVEEHFK